MTVTTLSKPTGVEKHKPKLENTPRKALKNRKAKTTFDSNSKPIKLFFFLNAFLMLQTGGVVLIWLQFCPYTE